eukprot:GFYU01000597.1.p1 GENE.GFYU01000597.1~~GFYU01000597.1.p1  ORF type:complete len:218 (+),score=34.92 GFYU01000597.1:101-754(+)
MTTQPVLYPATASSGLVEPEEILLTGEYDIGPLSKQLCCGCTCVCCWSVIGAPFVLLCLPCLPKFSKEYAEGLSIHVNKRSLITKQKAVCLNCWTDKEKTILLDRIQDVTYQQNLVNRCFGTTTLKVETAGQAGPDAGPEATIIGLKESKVFRDRLLQLRHDYVDGAGHRDGLGGVQRSVHAMDSYVGNMGGGEVVPLLTEIRDTLQRMEKDKTMSR